MAQAAMLDFLILEIFIPWKTVDANCNWMSVHDSEQLQCLSASAAPGIRSSTI